MEGKIFRKKRTMGIRKPKSLFNHLPTELQTKIFGGLSMKDQSKAMCVSHSWRNRILTTTLPKEYPLQPLVFPHLSPHPFYGLQQFFNWCSLVMCCNVSSRNIIDTCNGLFLFCHKDGQARNIVRGVYHYYVMNPIRKQCVAILKPSGQFFGGNSYAALVYDPSESWFFKIVHFQDHGHINIFSSMTGLWTTLTINFLQYINESYWVRKSVYLKGSIYRLSCSGQYLLKIKVDPQENASNQAEIITLHPDCVFDNCQREINLKDGKILLVSFRGVNFVCFELVECVTMGVSSYTWHTIHRKVNRKLLILNTNGDLLSFNSYGGVAFFKFRNLLYFYYYEFNGNGTNFGMVSYDPSVYDYIINCGHLLLKCLAPFACCLDKEVINCINFHKFFS